MFNFINKVKNRKGFTLVELLVVLAVLAIISAIAIPRFAGVQASAKVKADEETLNTVTRALELLVVTEGITVTTDTPIAAFTSGTFALKTEIDAKFASEIDKYLDVAKKLNSIKEITFTLNSKGVVTHTSLK